MRTWLMLALVAASLVACLPRQAVAAALQAIQSGGAPAGGHGGRRGTVEEEAPSFPGVSAMKIESENGDTGEEEPLDSPVAWASHGGPEQRIALPGAPIARRAERSSQSLADRTIVRRC